MFTILQAITSGLEYMASGTLSVVLFDLPILSHVPIQTLARSSRFYRYPRTTSTLYFSHGLLQLSSTEGDLASRGNTLLVGWRQREML